MEKRKGPKDGSPGPSRPQPKGPHDPLNTDLGEHLNDPSTVPTEELPSDIGSFREPRSEPMADSKRPEGPPPPPEDVPMDDASTLPESASDLGKPIFTGEHEELQGLWFHMTIKSILDPKLARSEEKQCAYLASCMKGRARSGLTEIYTRNPNVLRNYQALKNAVDEAFDLPESVKERLAEKKIMKLRQTTTALHYQSDFDALVIKLHWPESAKKALFFAGLKLAQKEKLILPNPIDTYSEMKDEAIRLDAALSNSTGTAVPGSKKPAGGKAKCAHCARTNHATKDSYAKKAVQAITYVGATPPSESNYRQVNLWGKNLVALVDTGSKINAIRASLASGELFKSTISIVDPVGRELENQGSYVREEIDGTIHDIYLIPDLTEELILGEPYLGGRGGGERTFLVDLTGPIPAGNRPIRYSDTERQALELFVATNLSEGNIRRSASPSPANALLVPKKDGTLRTVIDFRPVNSVTKRDGYPIPLLRESIDRARGFNYYCLVDLKNAFGNLRVRPGDEWKLAFRTHEGTFEFLNMPQGVTNGPSFFQRFIDTTLYQFRKDCVVYLDDILIFSNNIEHIDLVRRNIILVLAEKGVAVNEVKSTQPNQNQIFLGMRITPWAVEAVMVRETIRDWPAPRNKTQLQYFLGLANWFRDFVPNLSEKVAPLYELTGASPWSWQGEQRQSFLITKDALCAHVTTRNWDPLKPTEWYVDASQFGLGGVMKQGKHFVAVISRGLSPAERNYTTTERKVLAVVHAAKKWRHFLESSHQPVTVFTDHMAITQTLNADGTNRRINRWQEILMGLPMNLRFVAGQDNPADLPSRRADYEPELAGGEADVYSEDDYPKTEWDRMGDSHLRLMMTEPAAY